MKVTTDDITETVEVVTEPVSLAEAKAHLRVDISDDDSDITGMIETTRAFVEWDTGRSFAQHTYRADLFRFYDQIVLPGRPIQSITSIKYFDTASPQVLTTLSTNVYSLVKDTIYRNGGQVWGTHSLRPDAVQIIYVTGWADQSSPVGVNAGFPKMIYRAMLLIIGDLYENREAQFTTNFQQIQPNLTVKAMLNPYRVYL